MIYLEFVSASRNYLNSIGAAITVARGNDMYDVGDDGITVKMLKEVELAIHRSLALNVEELKDDIKTEIGKYSGEYKYEELIDPRIIEIRKEENEPLYQSSDVDEAFRGGTEKLLYAYQLMTSVRYTKYLYDRNDQEARNGFLGRFFELFYY